MDSKNAAIVADRALTLIESHTEVCDQRYEVIEGNQKEIKQTVKELDEKIDENHKELGSKIDKIDKKIIWAMATITGVMMAGKFILDVILGTPILSAIQKIHGG